MVNARPDTGYGEHSQGSEHHPWREDMGLPGRLLSVASSGRVGGEQQQMVLFQLSVTTK